MDILVLDVGGTNVKVWMSGDSDKEKFPSGKEMTPAKMVEGFKAIVKERKYDRISIGYPGNVLHGRPTADPCNLGPGWVDFEYQEAFGCPVRIMNDACMQALGSYEGGRMLYLGLGTGIGSAYIIDGKVVPLAIGELKFHRGETFDHYLSRKGFERYGEKGWRRAVTDAVAQLKNVFFADYVVLGGGNAKKVEELPPDCRRGGNHNAYFGGIRMWEDVALQEGLLAPKMENPAPDAKHHEKAQGAEGAPAEVKSEPKAEAAPKVEQPAAPQAAALTEVPTAPKVDPVAEVPPPPKVEPKEEPKPEPKVEAAASPQPTPAAAPAPPPADQPAAPKVEPVAAAPAAPQAEPPAQAQAPAEPKAEAKPAPVTEAPAGSMPTAPTVSA